MARSINYCLSLQYLRGGPQFSAFLQAYKEYSFCLPPLPYQKAYYKNADLCMLAYTIGQEDMMMYWTGLL